MPRESKPHLHNGYWRVRIRGVEHHLGQNRMAAMAKFHALMADQLAQDDGDRPATIIGAVEGWLQLNPKPIYRDWLRPFVHHLGSTALVAVGPDLLIRYHDHLRRYTYQRLGKLKNRETGERQKLPAKRLAPKTIRHYIRAATAVLRWVVKRGWVRTMPEVPSTAAPMHRPRDLSPERLRALLSELPDNAGRILRFIAGSGCRPSEACKLRWKHVHVAARVCLLPEHKTAAKTGKPRAIHLTDEALVVLQGLTVTGPDDPVFVNRAGEPYTPAGLRSILRNHDHELSGAYMLRHTFAQIAADSGTPEEVLGKLLGHSTREATRLYYEVRDVRAGDAAKRLRIAGGAG